MSYNPTLQPINGKFYKFREFGSEDSDERQFVESIISERNLWFATPSTLNDPRDCRPELVFGGSPKKKRTVITNSFLRGEQKRGYSLLKAERSRRVSNLMRELSTPQGRVDTFQPFFDEKVSVMCMSKRFDIAAQWTQYGGENTGLCFEFQINEQTVFEPVYEVSYRDTLPQFDLIKAFNSDESLTDSLMEVVTTKRTEYSTEEEARAISIERSGLIQYPVEMLISVTFGNLAAEKDVDWCMNKISISDVSPLLYRLEIDPESNQLSRVQL